MIELTENIAEQTIEAYIPQWFASALTNILGRNLFDEPYLKAELDTDSFDEPLWVIKEWWSPESFGSPEDWARKVYFDGDTFDAGEYPSRGRYVTVLTWADNDGKHLPLCQDLIDRLNFQRTMREQKKISLEDTVLQVAERQEFLKKRQKERIAAHNEWLAEDIKMKKEAILTAKTREIFLPENVRAANSAKN